MERRYLLVGGLLIATGSLLLRRPIANWNEQQKPVIQAAFDLSPGQMIPQDLVIKLTTGEADAQWRTIVRNTWNYQQMWEQKLAHLGKHVAYRSIKRPTKVGSLPLGTELEAFGIVHGIVKMRDVAREYSPLFYAVRAEKLSQKDFHLDGSNPEIPPIVYINQSYATLTS